MTRRTSLLAAASLGALLCTAGLSIPALSARQAAQDEPMPGSKMTRQQLIDRLTSATPGTKVSVERGKQLYEEVCAACHIFGDVGTSVGPDLTTLASRFRRADVLDSILWPSKTISDQYAVTVFELTDGTYASGVVIREDARAVYLKNAEYLDRPLPIALGRIKDRTESTVSLMPEGLVATHSLDDVDSLVAYVLGGK
ncbi:MAG: c-type cytochrome [Acidobacteria bacterium]|nr:c-type cytochrome [Acidobacteriota bacterium]